MMSGCFSGAFTGKYKMCGCCRWNGCRVPSISRVDRLSVFICLRNVGQWVIVVVVVLLLRLPGDHTVTANRSSQSVFADACVGII